MGDNTNVIKNSKIFNSAVSFTREDNHWPYNISTRGMVRSTVTCFFSQTVTSLEPLFTKDLFGTTSKKTGVSSMLPTSARGYFPVFKNSAYSFSSNCLGSFCLIEVRLQPVKMIKFLKPASACFKFLDVRLNFRFDEFF